MVKTIKTFSLSETTIDRMNKTKTLMNNYRGKLPYHSDSLTNSQVVESAIEYYYNYLRRKS